jgi:hypothetical protein
MKIIIWDKFFLLRLLAATLLLFLITFPDNSYAASLKRIAVVSVVNQSKEPEFNNLLIAQGIAHLVAQELYDTGKYIPVEDNPEITKKIGELVKLSSSSINPASELTDPESIKKLLGCDVIVTTKILSFSKSRSRMFAGPFSGATVEVNIDVEISLQENKDKTISETGSGSGKTHSRGILFEVRNDKVHFDKTSVGQATQEAVQKAVTKLVKGKEGA